MLCKHGPQESLEILSEELVSYSQNQSQSRLLMMTGLSLAPEAKIDFNTEKCARHSTW